MQKHKVFQILIVLMLLAFSAVNVMAQQTDSDGDGVPDTSDNCPNVAGPVANGGCPTVGVIVAPQQPVDTDGDGLPDTRDQCPTVAGPLANSGCPTSGASQDTDGDGLPDSSDGCPTVAGPRELNGCPDTTVDSDGDSIPDAVDNCTSVPGTPENNGCPPGDVTSVQPFAPPALPTDGCYVTPAGNYNVFVRVEPTIDANSVGTLFPGQVYPSTGYVMANDGAWFFISGFEGYSASSVLLSSACGELSNANGVDASDLAVWQSNYGSSAIEIPEGGILVFDINGLVVDPDPEEPGFDLFNVVIWSDPGESGDVVPTDQLSLNFGEIEFEYTPVAPFELVFDLTDTDDGMQTVEYCIYQEVQEAGVFEEVCYEVEIPENCELTTIEAGVYTVECEEEATVAFDLPYDLLGDDNDNDLDRLPQPNDDGTTTVEYCIYQEVQEAGVFEEVCYEIEIPENCELRNPEAGVYIVECDVEAETTFDLPFDLATADDDFDDFPPIQNGDDGTQTVEYCIYQEVQEAGVFEEVCYEIEIPENCELTTIEAGVYTVVCDEGGTVSVNPLFEGLPALDFAIPDDPTDPILIGLLVPAVQQ